MIAVAGGGIIGLSIAWRLAQRGFGVRVFDAAKRGGESSAAGAGMLAPGGEMAGDAVWTPLGVESMSLYPGFVAELARESGVEIDFRICGAIDLALAPEDWPALRERARRQMSAGIASTETPEGLSYAGDGYVNSRDVLAGLRRVCDMLGIEVTPGAILDRIESGEWEAVVVAAGAWSGTIEVAKHGAALPLPKTIPVKGHLAGYRLAPGSLSRVLRHGHTYILQRANGYTIAGSNEERIGFDTRVDDAICRDIHARACVLWPQLEGRGPDDCWIGLRPATEDLLPKIGRFEDTNVWMAYGHYRNGILLAPVTAERVAREIGAILRR